MFSQPRTATTISAFSVLLLCGVASFSANAQEVTRTGDVNSLVNCANQATKDEQLTCFLELTEQVKGQPAVITNEVTVTRVIEKPADEEPTPGMFAKMRSRLGITRTEQSKELDQITAAPDTPTGIGAEQVVARSKISRKKKANKQKKQTVTASLTDFAVSRGGKYIFFLDNGQIWRQKQSDTNPMRISKKRSYDVVIFRGRISGYRLSLTKIKRPFAVERIK